MYVKNGNGELPYEDVVLDFSNPETVKWYQDKLAGLLNIGVSAIKVDFGEAAPLNGIYASGKSGWYEHNLYPVRYDMAVSEITKKLHNENIMWARAAWAGSQRYPLHWGGDAATTNTGLLGTLRAGLSFGLSGFSFWSHDMGGFVNPLRRTCIAAGYRSVFLLPIPARMGHLRQSRGCTTTSVCRMSSAKCGDEVPSDALCVCSG